jgi:hypothetical protein
LEPVKAQGCDVYPTLPGEFTYTQNNAWTELKGRGNLIPSNGHFPTPYFGQRLKVTYNPFDVWGYVTYGCVVPDTDTIVERHCRGKQKIPYTHYLSGVTASKPGGKYQILPKHHLGLRAETRNAVLAQLSKAEISLGETLGEVSETAGLLLGRTLQLAFLLDALRRGKLKQAGKVLKGGNLGIRHRKVPYSKKSKGTKPSKYEVYQTSSTSGDVLDAAANTYLEGKYGWAPIISDIYALAQGVLDRLNQSAGFPIESVTRTRTETQGVPLLLVPGYYSRSGSVTYGYKVGVSYAIDDPTLAGLNALGLYNPFALGWELLPLSFVIDWVASIGSFLSGLSAGIGLVYLHGYETRWVAGDIFVEDRTVQVNWNLPYGTPPSCTAKYSCFVRELLGDFPAPAVRISLQLNLNQLSTLMALFQQRLGK